MVELPLLVGVQMNPASQQQPVLALDPVSYTHLDVYKRQVLNTRHRHSEKAGVGGSTPSTHILKHLPAARDTVSVARTIREHRTGCSPCRRSLFLPTASVGPAVPHLPRRAAGPGDVPAR